MEVFREQMLYILPTQHEFSLMLKALRFITSTLNCLSTHVHNVVRYPKKQKYQKYQKYRKRFCKVYIFTRFVFWVLVYLTLFFNVFTVCVPPLVFKTRGILFLNTPWVWRYSGSRCCTSCPRNMNFHFC